MRTMVTMLTMLTMLTLRKNANKCKTNIEPKHSIGANTNIQPMLSTKGCCLVKDANVTRP